jgi:hypothetical protein
MGRTVVNGINKKKATHIWDEQGEEQLLLGSIRLLKHILQAMQFKGPVL